jgi:hypothetical protein
MIAAGQTATFYVAFRPGGAGPSSARLTINNNDPNESQFDFALAGTGIAPRPALDVATPSLDVTLPVGGSSSATIAISNPGTGSLTYTASSSLDAYSFRDSDAPGGPAYNWLEISAAGTLIQSWSDLDDAATPEIPLGFTLPLYGASLSTVRIDTNGFIGGPKIIPYGQNGPLPNTSAALPMIAPFWTDVIIDAGSRVFWQNVGGNFVVQYDNVSLLGAADRRFTAEAILRPNGEIIFQYKALSAVSASYSIGLQNARADDGLLVSYGHEYAHAGMAIRIRPPGLESWLNVGASSGSIAAGGSQNLGVTVNGAGLPPGNYFAEILVASDASGTAGVRVPVLVTIANTPVQNWRLAKFGTIENTGLAADGANPDGDARINLLEYALVSEPLSSDASSPPLVTTNAGGYLQLQFTRDPARSDLRYYVEATSDLTAAWTLIATGIHGAPITATGAHSSVEMSAGALKTVTVEDTAPAAAFTARYLRLRVVLE